jgi:hypothetical protein
LSQLTARSIALYAAVAVAAAACVAWWRIRYRREPVFRHAALDQPFELGVGSDGVEVAHTRFRLVRRHGQLLLQEGWPKEDGTSVALSALPHAFGRCEVSLIEIDGGRARLSARERPCDSMDFKQIEGKAGESGPCTPLVSSEWRGIRLAAPSEVHYAQEAEEDWRARRAAAVSLRGESLPKTPKIIVSGIYRFDWEALRRAGLRALPDHGAPTLGWVNLTTKEKGSSSIKSLALNHQHYIVGISAPLMVEPPWAIGDQEGAFGSAFNVDLGILTIRPPDAPTDYLVYAELGPYRSNEVRIRVYP